MYKQYTSDEVIVIVNLRPIAFETVTVSKAEDKRTMQVGINGSSRHIRNLKDNGTVTIEVMDYSPSNTDLSVADKLNVPVIITIIDKSTMGTNFSTENAMLAKDPDLSRSGEGGTNEWVFNFGEGAINHTGAKSY